MQGGNFELKKLVYNETILKKKEQDDKFIELIHEKLLDTFIFNAIWDWKQIPTAIALTHLSFHRNKWLPMWNLTAHQKSKPREATYCVLGNNKGEIFFVDIENRAELKAKVHFHSESINFIREIKNKQEGLYSFLSMSTDRQICIWNLSHQLVPATVISLNYNRNITYIELYENYLLLGEKSGEFNIIRINVGEDSVSMEKSTNTTGHLRPVNCGDYMKYKGHDLFLSGG